MDISVLFTICVSGSAEMCTTFPFSATKIGQYPTSALFGTPFRKRKKNKRLIFTQNKHILLWNKEMLRVNKDEQRLLSDELSNEGAYDVT